MTIEKCTSCGTGHMATPVPGESVTWRCRQCSTFMNTAYDAAGVPDVTTATEVQVLRLEMRERRRDYEGLRRYYDALKPEARPHAAYPPPSPAAAYHGFIFSEVRQRVRAFAPKFLPADICCNIGWDIHDEKWGASISVWSPLITPSPRRLTLYGFASPLDVVAAIENWLETDAEMIVVRAGAIGKR